MTGSEKHAEKVRGLIANFTLPELLSQEMYDFSYEDRIKQLADPSVYLDPKLFYRALEEYFNINMFFFTQGSEKGGTDSGRLVIPNHKVFYSKPLRYNRATFLYIITKSGTRNEVDENLQCEPIILTSSRTFATHKLIETNLWEGIDAQNDDQKIRKFNHLMNELWNKAYSTISWGESIDKNIFSTISIVDRLPGQVISQKIDDKGKAYAFNVNYKTDKGYITYSIYCTPTQPMNIMTDDTIARIGHIQCAEIFGMPSSHSLKNNKLDGYWYKLEGRNRGFYIPLDDKSVTIKGSKYIYDPPYNVESESIVIKRYKFNRYTIFINEIISFLYYFSRDEAYDFWTKYVVSANSQDNGLNFYDFSRIKVRLPNVSTLEEAFSEFHKLGTGLISKEGDEYKIIAYNDTFALKLKSVIRNISLSIKRENEKPKYIKGFYTQPADYTKYDNTLIFHNEYELENWSISSQLVTSYENVFAEYDTISWDLSDRNIPYIFRQGNSYSLIQNVSYSTQAQYVALIWRERHYNPGYSVKGRTDIPADIYCVNSLGHPILIQESPEKNALKILYYGSPISYKNQTKKNMAAILPLL